MQRKWCNSLSTWGSDILARAPLSNNDYIRFQTRAVVTAFDSKMSLTACLLSSSR
jgi:hypothetical protein